MPELENHQTAPSEMGDPDMASAWRVVEEMHRQGYEYILHSKFHTFDACFFKFDQDLSHRRAEADSLYAAILSAAAQSDRPL